MAYRREEKQQTTKWVSLRAVCAGWVRVHWTPVDGQLLKADRADRTSVRLNLLSHCAHATQRVVG